ncbi:hypothetical protein THAOC_02275 [Thalassiosira oceanica]|uniref:MYND-type domain-containing protein n=1 Tax=Thalassiosira oceanica TaxID=159749 RepID=K0TG01_THAOC|nr:hypothetical protein THAOC_02275 [Thalassiosira oceanica]|eukprot:EJK75984.1 hypothetical protein THAOC_02275 [Thalassiosira oceanica]
MPPDPMSRILEARIDERRSGPRADRMPRRIGGTEEPSSGDGDVMVLGSGPAMPGAVVVVVGRKSLSLPHPNKSVDRRSGGLVDWWQGVSVFLALSTQMSCHSPARSAGTCANCGKEPSDAVKLKDCTACRIVKYCSVDCQRAHRKQHKKACKKRAAELKDEKLYGQGLERPEGDFCPICTLPIPLPMSEHSVFNVCCMKRICNGCDWAAQKRGMLDCAFCRTPVSGNVADDLAMIQARAGKKDPAAIFFLGGEILPWTIWIAEGHAKGSRTGEGIPQDSAKALRQWERAATQGSVSARHNLGIHDWDQGNYERGVKHFLIAAKMGAKISLDSIKDMFVEGVASKEQYADALKGYQDSMEEMASSERVEVKEIRQRRCNMLRLWEDVRL